MKLLGKSDGGHRHHHRVEVQIRALQQFFNSMDPSPFYEQDLDSDAEHFIVSWAEEFPLKEPVKLILHLETGHAGESQRAMVEEAVHRHFQNQARLARMEFRRLLRVGSRSLVIGLAALGLSLLGVEVLTGRDGALFGVLRQSLLIGGWVAMWQPMQTYLYGWWPLLRRRRIYEKMARMPVEITPAARRAAAHPAASR